LQRAVFTGRPASIHLINMLTAMPAINYPDTYGHLNYN